MSATPPEARPSYAGTSDYIASADLLQTVNVAVMLARPLLIKGEPGTGKTMLAQSIARGVWACRFITWNIKSTTKAQDGLYVYDTVQRLYDSQFQDHDVGDIKQYIKLGKLGDAFTAPRARGAADRRDRQGRPRVPQRPSRGSSTRWSSTSRRPARPSPPSTGRS